MDEQYGDPEPTAGQRTLLLGMALLFALVIALVAVDLIADFGEGTSASHVTVEGGVILFALGGLVLAGRHFSLLRRHSRALAARAERLEESLLATRREAEQWRHRASDLLAGLGAAIDEQLSQWQLSPAEKEVALLLLKGLSLKEIADIRGVGEATARQQARAVYRKAGLAGRRELASFFLEDLLLPSAENT